MAEKLHGVPEISPGDAIEATFHVLNRRVTGGELEDIRRMLPQEIRQMWPEEPGVGPAETRKQAQERKRQAESQGED